MINRILLSLVFALCALQAQADPVQVLAYHDVLEADNPQLSKDDMSVSTSHLIQHFRWLQENGFTPVSIDQIEAAANGQGELPAKPVLLTFDDGLQSVYTHVFPLLELFEYPAVVSLVTSWIEGDVEIEYAGRERDLRDFLSWEQIREMQASGLVEFASHSHNLHRGVVANPQGNTQPAAVALRYEDGKYESTQDHADRIRADLEKSAEIMEAQLGKRPRVMTWPYGAFNDVVNEIAREAGMSWPMTLEPNAGFEPAGRRIDRHLIHENPGIRELSAAVLSPAPIPLLRAARIEIDDIYDPDPVKQQANLDVLVERVYRTGLSHVYLQAFSDANDDGRAEALYFPNRFMPVKADLFNHVAWQLKTRSLVTVYAWMPVAGFESALPAGSEDSGLQATIRGIFEDLGTYARFDGIHFQDGPSQNSLGGPGDSSLALTDDLIRILSRYQQGLETSRNMFAPEPTDDGQVELFTQAFERYLDHYDFVSVMATLEEGNGLRGRAWQDFYRGLVATANQRQGALLRTLFQLQAINGENGEWVSSRELRDTMRMLQALGVKHIGYYPDDFLNNQPNQDFLRQGISIAEYTPEMQP